MDRKNLQRSSTVKDKWEYYNNVISEAEHSSTAGLEWPQRNYTCSFCKRGFRSAQALGGHMNVHRRDRAKLRQLPPWFFECPNLATSNSNPKPFLPSSSSKFLPYHDHSLFSPSLTSLSSPPSYPKKKSILKRPQSIDLTKKKGNTGAVVLGIGELKNKNVTQERDQRNEIVSLDLEMGCEDSKEVLDLELRLGCF